MEFNKHLRAVALAFFGLVGSFQVMALSGGVTTYRNSPTTTGTVERAQTRPAKTPELDQTYQRTMRKAQTSAAAAKALRGLIRGVAFIGTVVALADFARDMAGIWFRS